MGFFCLEDVRVRIKYCISACLLILENVGKSSVRENALLKNWSISASGC